MVGREAKVSTHNNPLDIDIACELEVTVPESIEEATEFYGGEGKLLDVIQAETVRRKINAARAVLRDAEVEQDWAGLATTIAEQYTPGRRGGFQSPSVSADELSDASGDMDALLALLASRGVSIGA